MSELNDLDKEFIHSEGETPLEPELLPENSFGEEKAQAIAVLSAKGMSAEEIGKAIGLGTRTVAAYLQNDRVQFEIRQLAYKIHGNDIQKRFRDLLPKAVDIAEEVMNNPNSKPAIKLAAAHNIMDRALGKPKQTMEVEGSLIKQLFERLDSQKPKEVVQVIDVVPSNHVTKDHATEAEKPNDKTDEWVLENLT